VSIRLYDTSTQTMRDFVPISEGKAGIYVCGLTTQGAPHIGHVRSAVAFDILRRWLVRGHGFEVTMIRNVTDIDDKILARSGDADAPWWAWSYANERATNDALDLLGVVRTTYEPRATGHITEMIEIMQTLVDKGHAYAAQDGSGDVYFDVRSYPAYGELTHQRIEDMEPAADSDQRGKRDPRDFALWKGHKAGEPETASWPTPFGQGRPGWHLECSAMARKYLGDTFDIHGGGVDLRFPHHENEQAQSRAAGLGFANYWLHNAWVTVSGEKMGKSLGNALLVSEVTKVARPLAVRYYLGAAHYRSTVEYHEGSLREAEAAVSRIEGFLRRAVGDGFSEYGTEMPAEFSAAMDDDLNVSGALAVIHETVRAGNTALDEGDEDDARRLGLQVVVMAEVMGINPLSPPWNLAYGSEADDAKKALDSLVLDRIEARAAARAARDFTAADQIRDQLTAAGITVEDTSSGARWSLARRTDA
jgi:cysteinyl-tRNA synthetase